MIEYTGARVEGVRSIFCSIKADIQDIKSDIQEIKSDIKDLKVSFHKMELKIEEQNNRDKIVLDALARVIYRQERFEVEYKKS